MPDLPLTEQRNPSTAELDRLGTADLLHRINDEDRRVPWAVEREIDAIASAVDAITDRLRTGGRVHYFGAGTSGRLGMLDAVEIPPTFSISSDMFVAHIAGGRQALTEAVEGAEDDRRSGADEVGASGIGPADVAIGLSASGAAPYVLGALHAARGGGALTVAITNTPRSPLAALAHISIAPLAGPEVLTGSTRMKAGSAQKLVLNMLSTAVMVKLGKVHGNWMVDVRPTNAKLRARAVRIVADLSGSSAADANARLSANEWRVKPAIVELKFGCSSDEAVRRLADASGSLRAALEKGGAPSASK
ncbi:MAG TPA: N-acetylmuramic acid 6-phosphate etherase [Candidatus Eremiobacteraceae bacterium]|nr:N-acetylmuramic acid 6-phosphate etherase [Candidatus Eremiobacteraceae bacterium]